MTAPKEGFDVEIASLREQLRELEELRDSIVRGGIDAVVVGPDDDAKRVLMLSAAYVRYRKLVEDMEEGAVTVTRGGEILFLNKSFADILDCGMRSLFRDRLSKYVAPADQSLLDAVVSRHDARRQAELSMKRPDGTLVKVRIAVIDDLDDFTTLLVTNIDGRDRLSEAGDAVRAIRKGQLDGVVDDSGNVTMLAAGALDPPHSTAELAKLADSVRASLERIAKSGARSGEIQARLPAIAHQLQQLAALCDELS